VNDMSEELSMIMPQVDSKLEQGLRLAYTEDISSILAFSASHDKRIGNQEREWCVYGEPWPQSHSSQSGLPLDHDTVPMHEQWKFRVKYFRRSEASPATIFHLVALPALTIVTRTRTLPA
jgi:hypothetical protein